MIEWHEVISHKPPPVFFTLYLAQKQGAGYATWTIGPSVGELAESRTPTQVMKVWPSRDDIVTTTADDFNAELDALLDKHCLCV